MTFFVRDATGQQIDQTFDEWIADNRLSLAELIDTVDLNDWEKKLFVSNSQRISLMEER